MVGKITTYIIKVVAAPVMPYLKGLTLPADENHLVFILVKSNHEETGCRFIGGLLSHLSPSWLCSSFHVFIWSITHQENAATLIFHS